MRGIVRLSSIERIADAMALTVMLVPEHMAPEIRRYVASQGRVFTTTKTNNLAKCGCLLSTQHSDLSTDFGTFARDWVEEEELDKLIDNLEAGRISHKQGLLRAQKLLLKFPGQLEIQNFIANRLWSLEMRDEATEVREKPYRQASALIAPGFKGQISWAEVDNRSFLRVAHGYLLGLMHRGARGFPDVHSALSPQHSDLFPCAHADGRHQPDDRRQQECDEKLSERSRNFTGALVPGGPNCVS